MANINLNGYSTSNNTLVTCDKYSFSGSYTAGGFISKTFNNIPLNHYQIVIRFSLGMIGSWDIN